MPLAATHPRWRHDLYCLCYLHDAHVHYSPLLSMHVANILLLHFERSSQYISEISISVQITSKSCSNYSTKSPGSQIFVCRVEPPLVEVYARSGHRICRLQPANSLPASSINLAKSDALPIHNRQFFSQIPIFIVIRIITITYVVAWIALRGHLWCNGGIGPIGSVQCARITPVYIAGRGIIGS